MKKLGTFVLLAPAMAFAGDGNYSRVIADYDADTGQYFEEVNAREEKALLLSSSEAVHTVNVFIYNPSTKTGRTVFAKPVENINLIYFESEYDARDKKMTVLGRADKAKNNANIESRRPNSSLLLETFDSKEKRATVWKADKTYGEPKAVFSYAAPSKWHVDVKSRVLRLLTKTEAGYSVTEYLW